MVMRGRARGAFRTKVPCAASPPGSSGALRQQPTQRRKCQAKGGGAIEESSAQCAVGQTGRRVPCCQVVEGF
jgi:hypothetical protein